MAALRESLRVFIDRNLSPAAQSAKLAEVARGAVRSAVTAQRFPPTYETFVDGRAGADESTVSPHGLVSYQADFIGRATEFALVFLAARAQPEASGRYVRGFRVAVDGVPYTAAQFDKSIVPPGAEVLVFNVEPYSRKIDVGYSGTRRLKYRIPAGLFDDAASAIKRQFRGLVMAKRLYSVRFPGQSVTRHGGRLIDSPAVLISRV